MKVIRALGGALVIISVFLIPKVALKASLEKPKCNCYFPNFHKYGVTKGDHCEVVECESPTPTPTPKS